MDSSSVYARHAAQRKPPKEEDNSKRTAITRVTREYDFNDNADTQVLVCVPYLDLL